MCINESGFGESGTDFPDLFPRSAFSIAQQPRLSGGVCTFPRQPEAFSPECQWV